MASKYEGFGSSPVQVLDWRRLSKFKPSNNAINGSDLLKEPLMFVPGMDCFVLDRGGSDPKYGTCVMQWFEFVNVSKLY